MDALGSRCLPSARRAFRLRDARWASQPGPSRSRRAGSQLPPGARPASPRRPWRCQKPPRHPKTQKHLPLRWVVSAGESGLGWGLWHTTRPCKAQLGLRQELTAASRLGETPPTKRASPPVRGVRAGRSSGGGQSPAASVGSRRRRSAREHARVFNAHDRVSSHRSPQRLRKPAASRICGEMFP